MSAKDKDHFERYLDGELSTTSGEVPKNFNSPAPDLELERGQHKSYWVLSEAERKKGFIRPVRRTYLHQVCGTTTRMAVSIAETYARDPKFYSHTFCYNCNGHFPVGEEGAFVWDGTEEKVGT